MERAVLRMLAGMIETTEERELKEELRQHKLETERHAARMQQRLEAHSATPSVVKGAGGIARALIKSVVDRVRGE
jgi:ferritin-like metal-binding protein YciE